MASPFEPRPSQSREPAGTSDALGDWEIEDGDEPKTRPLLPPVTLESPASGAPPTIPSLTPSNPDPRPPILEAPRRPPQTRLELRLARVKRDLERGFRQGARFIDQERTRLPLALQKRLARVPSEALFGLAIAIPFFVLGVGVVGVTVARAPAMETASAPSASTASTASKRPDTAVRALGRRAADGARDPRAHSEVRYTEPPPVDEGEVLLKLAESFAARGRSKPALDVLDRLLARYPELGKKPRVAAILLLTVNAEEAASFALLETMGEAGAAIIYRLASSEETASAPKRRAEAWLKTQAFDRAASLPLYALVKLRLAKSCEEKRALLGLAGAGGRETLDYLRELEARPPCVPKRTPDCFECLRADARLSEAIRALERRLGG